MALLHWLCQRGPQGGFQVAAAHFNHQLRPSAGADEEFVRAWCREHRVPLSCGGEDVGAYARERGASLEDAGRVLRYRFLEKTAGELGADRIATAHHREDNAETVLLHLLRGTGLQGLTGIAPVRGKIVRPLLEVSRKEIDRYVAQNGIPFVEDSSNASPAFTRNRLRLEVMPLLEDIAPGCAGRIAAAGALLREEEAYLQREAGRACSISYEAGSAVLAGLWDGSAVTGRRAIRSAARQLGVELDRRATENVWNLSSGGYLDLPGGLSARRHGGELTLWKKETPPPPLTLRLGDQAWGPWRVRVRRRDGAENPQALLLDGDVWPLTIAAWDGTGRLAVENGSRTVKRLFADRGIPVERRERHPALLWYGSLAGVFGVGVDWNLRPQLGRPCLEVSLEEV